VVVVVVVLHMGWEDHGIIGCEYTFPKVYRRSLKSPSRASPY
jgi:hypothetical protein